MRAHTTRCCEPSVRGKFYTKHPDAARRRHPRRLVRRRRGLVAQGHTAGRRLLPRCTVRFDPWTASPDLVWTGDIFGARILLPVVLHRRPKLRRRTSRPPMLSPARRSDAGGPNLQPLHRRPWTPQYLCSSNMSVRRSHGSQPAATAPCPPATVL